MGLDQYAYVAAKAGVRDDYWAGVELNPETGNYFNPTVNEPMEIAYWRKHPNLQGWMEELWIKRGRPGVDTSDAERSFNCIELELTWNDLDDLERAVRARILPETTGFFFGRNSDDEYYEQDLEFIKNAKAEIFLGLKVFYNSSW